jgi:hypothetical protein
LWADDRRRGMPVRRRGSKGGIDSKECKIHEKAAEKRLTFDNKMSFIQNLSQVRHFVRSRCGVKKYLHYRLF